MADDYVASPLGSANTRTHRIKSFLAKPPRKASQLRMVAAGAEAEAQVPLGSWEMAEVLPELALEIVDMLDQHAVEMGGHVTASLSYVDEGGKVIKTIILNRQANHVVTENGLLAPEEMNGQLTGDARSQAAGAQRHLEVMARVYMAGMAGLLAHSERLVSRQSEMLETLAGRLGRAERRIDAKESELQELVDILRELRASEREAAEPASNPTLERAWKLMESLAPHLMAQMMANNAPRPQAHAEAESAAE